MRRFDTNNNLQAFFALVRAGLWEKEVRLESYEKIDFSEVYHTAEVQSVVGLISAGLDYVNDVKPPREVVLKFVGHTLQIEQRNKAMNTFIEKLIGLLRENDVYALLIKGQGIAHCYEKPKWRACGDIDLFLSNGNYDKAKTLLVPMATEIEEEDKNRKHLALTIDSFVVELHGKINGGISKRERRGLDNVKIDIFECGAVRSWLNGTTQIFLPSVDNDVLIIFTHILEHFYYGGIGLRQVCDWCRLLWTFRETIDKRLLESRIKKMGLMTEWKAFAALAVNNLGMPVEAIPMYNTSRKWSRKSDRILSFIIETGNFGHNRDSSYYQKYPFMLYKTISFFKNTRDSIRHLMIFPMDATRVWWRRLFMGVKALT